MRGHRTPTHTTSCSRVIISHNGSIREDLKTHIGGSGRISSVSAGAGARASGTAAVGGCNENIMS